MTSAPQIFPYELRKLRNYHKQSPFTSYLYPLKFHCNNEVRWTCHSPNDLPMHQADPFEELPTSASWGPAHINCEGFTCATGIGMIWKGKQCKSFCDTSLFMHYIFTMDESKICTQHFGIVWQHSSLLLSKMMSHYTFSFAISPEW